MSDYSGKKDVFAKKYFFLIIGMTIVFWAFAFPLIKIGLEELSPVNLTIMRLLVACIVFLILLPTIPNKFSKLHKKDILPIFLLGFTGIVIYHLGLNYGEQDISPSAASLIIATIPIFVVVLAVIFLKEKITLKIVLGIILSLVGVVIISIIGKPDILIEINYVSGAFAVLIGAIVGAGYTVAGKKMLSRYSALSLTVYAFLFGSLGLIPFISNSLFEEVVAMSVTGWSVVIFLGIFSTVISYVLWYVALEIKSASKISVYLYFIPVLSTIISFILFQDKITWLFIFGGALVILGLYIVNKQRIETT
jgi:drug/metabolite transporter (DMT)-like permease